MFFFRDKPEILIIYLLILKNIHGIVIMKNYLLSAYDVLLVISNIHAILGVIGS